MTNEEKIEKVVKYLHEVIDCYEDFMDTHIRIKGERVCPADFDSLTMDLLIGHASEKELADNILKLLEKG